jgi:archaellum component FlaC
MNIQEANDKFINITKNTELTDGELCGLLNVYKRLTESMEFLDNSFSIFKQELHRRYQGLLCMDHFRQEERKQERTVAQAVKRLNNLPKA